MINVPANGLRFCCSLAAAISCVVWLAPLVTADAPEGQYIAVDGTVEDTKTRLVWQQSVGSQRTWEEAKDYCATLSLAGSGWRLPGLKELLTLVDPTRSMPAIDMAFFPGAPPGFFWTASRHAGGPEQIHCVSFEYGGSYSKHATNTKAHVRCVR